MYVVGMANMKFKKHTKAEFIAHNIPHLLRLIEEAKKSDTSSNDMAIVEALAAFIPDHITE